MKELSIEEKAKRYDEALEKAKSWHVDVQIDFKKSLETLFPELKESWDEKIRKALHERIINYDPNNEILIKEEGISQRQFLDWLEKQDEKPKKVSIWKHWKNGIAGNGDGKLIYLVKDGNNYSFSSGLGFECDYIELSELDKLLSEKQGEQKPADKIEPKFKVGDTVTVKPMSCHGKVFKGEPFKIVDIIEDNYVSDDGKTYSISLQDGWELVQQNPAWSEEDEARFESCIKVLQTSDGYDTINTKWLKSIKDRILPQNTWKPSEEQIKALLKLEEMHVLEHEKNQENAHLYMVVKSIREQLLKLRER